MARATTRAIAFSTLIALMWIALCCGKPAKLRPPKPRLCQVQQDAVAHAQGQA